MKLAAWLQDQRSTVQSLIRPYTADFTQEFCLALFEAVEQNNNDLFLPVLHKFHSLCYAADKSSLATLLALQKSLVAALRKTLPPPAALEAVITLQDHFSEACTYLANLETEEKLRSIETSHLDKKRLNQHKTDFISVASHELKTPLTLIDGYSNMLQADLSEKEHPRLAMMLSGITSGTRRMREIIEDLMDVSLLEMKLMKFYFQPFWIKRLLDMIVSEMGKIALERQIQIIIQRETLPDGSLYGDPERLYQAFEKVIENAIKYTPDGGKIRISGRKIDGNVEIVVRDSGIGINPVELPLIFEKFYSLGKASLHSSSKTQFKGGGPGLGLTIAKGIIEAHGGSIWAESEAYDEKRFPGSHFHVVLPIQPEKATISSHPALAYPVEGLDT